MERIISKVLNKFLGDWIENLNSEQLSISLFKGVVSLENLSLKSDILHLLGLPITLNHGTVKKILVKIPWKNLLSSPLTIEVCDVHAYLTPKSPSSWSEQSELQALLKSKYYSIDKFEAYETEEIKEENSNPGFAKRAVIKIIENVQIIIKNLYIRYEDSISDPFAFGVMLKELTVNTCDQSWEPKFNNDNQFINKLITIIDFTIFCDYRTEKILLTQAYQNEIDVAFPTLVQDEFNSVFDHNYLIRPFSIVGKFTILKEKKRYDVPFLHSNIQFTSFVIDFYSGQIKFILKFIELMKLYNIFKLGIKELKIEYVFTEETEKAYAEFYRDWMHLTNLDKKKKALEVRNKLMEMEVNITLEEIIRSRSAILNESNREKAIEHKIKEIDQLKKELDKKSGSISGLLKKFRERKEEKRKRLEESLAAAEKDLEKILNASNFTRSSSFDMDPPEWEKFMGVLSIEKGGVSIYSDQHKLLISKYASIGIAFSLKPTNLNVNIQIDQFEIFDLILKESAFPKLFELSYLALSFSRNPLRITIESGDTYIFCMFSSIFSVIDVFRDATSTGVDISPYKNLLNESYDKYLETGQNYVMSAITKEEAPIEMIDFALNVRAPIFILPLQPRGETGFLYLDLGIIQLNSLKEHVKQNTNECYKFKLSSLQAYMVWQWKSFEDKKTWLTTNIINPITTSVSITFSKHAMKTTEISFDVNISQTQILLNSLILHFLSDLIRHIVFFFPSSNDEAITHVLVEQKDVIRVFKEFKEIIPIKFCLEIACFELALNSMRELAFFALYAIKFCGNISSIREVEANLQITSIKADDKQPNSVFSAIICNPNMKFLGLFKQASDKHQLLINLIINPCKNLTDMCIIIDDLRLTISFSFISSLLDILKDLSQLLPQQPNAKSMPTYYIDSDYNMRITAHLKNLEFCIPADSLDLDSQTAHIFLSLTAVYVSSYKAKSYYNAYNNQLFINYSHRTDELSMCLSHFGAEVKNSFYETSGNRYLILPSRISLETTIAKRTNENVLESFSMIRIESLCIYISIRDIHFIRKVADNFSKIASNSSKQARETNNEFSKEMHEFHYEIGLDIDALQITMIDDTTKYMHSLFFIQFSNISCAFLKKLEKTIAKAEIIALINSYSKSLGSWEPVLEECKFLLRAVYGDLNLDISLESRNVIDINFTYSLAQCLGIVINKLPQDSALWAKDQEKDSTLTDQNKFEYVILNQLEIPITVWLSIEKIPEKWTINSTDSYSFSQRLIDSLHAQSTKKSKATLSMNNIQIPTQLAFRFSESNPNIYYVLIDEVAMKVILVSAYNNQFHCLINITSQEGKRLIIFDTAVLISNNCDEEIKGSINKLDFTLTPRSAIFLPIELSINYSNYPLLTHNQSVRMKNSSNFTIDEKYYRVLEINEIQIDHNQSVSLIELSPEILLKNLLNSTIRICDEDQNLLRDEQNEILSIEPGSEVALNLNSNSQYSLHLIDQKTRKTNLTKTQVIFIKKEIVCSIEELPESSIVISPSQKEKDLYQVNLKGGSSCYDFDLSDCKRISKISPLSSCVYSIYSDYIIINKSQMILNLEGMEIPTDELRYYSSKSKKLRVKLKRFETKWSERFRVDTIGVSGLIIIRRKRESFPRYFLLGVCISQAPSPMINSRLITFAPRFMIWNYLDFPISVKQYNSPNSNSIRVDDKSESEFNSVVYSLDDYSISKAIMISCDEKNWSGPFNIETIEDFQIRVTDLKNIRRSTIRSADIEWYLPSNRYHLRFIRIKISSEDEATIHIAIMNPKDPDYRVVNKTDHSLLLRQKLWKGDHLQLEPCQSMNWAWEDHLTKSKKIEVLVGDHCQAFSIEKVKEYKTKQLMGFQIYVKVNNLTRELIIDKPRQQIDDVSVKEKVSLKEKEPLENNQFNPRYAALLYRPSELLNFAVASLTEIKKYSVKASLKLSGIGLSIFDINGKESLYISLNRIKLFQEYNQHETVAGFLLKKTNIFKANLKIKNFQIDSMDHDPSLFPVILTSSINQSSKNKEFHKSNTNPTEDSKIDENSSTNNTNAIPIENNQKCEIPSIKSKEKYNFLMFDLELQSSSKIGKSKAITSIITVENFELLMQKIEIKLNQEIIMKLIQLRDYRKAFQRDKDTIEISDTKLLLSNALPILQYEKSSRSTKIYFHLVKLGVLQIFITFKKASVSGGTKEIKYQFGLDLIKNIGGAFANVSKAPFNFNELIVINSFQTFTDFSTTIGQNYLRQGIIQFYKIFGSIDLIGNPLGLVEKLGTGVFEFFAEPAKGLIGGPKAFAKGLGKGINSLLTGVIGGSFESISKISGTLYHAVKTATGDEISQYNPENESIGRNLLEGLKEGGLDIYHGLTGIISKPIIGGKTGGAKGFFKGVLSGASGLITTPVKLVLKVGHVISTSIASTAYLISNGKIQTYGRVRFPRHQSPSKLIQSYNQSFAQAQTLLYNCKNYHRERLIYCSEIHLEANSFVKASANVILLITPMHILYILNGELYKQLLITEIAFLELHQYNKMYLLCFTSERLNFSIPSNKYSELYCIYSALYSFNPNILPAGNHYFKRPKMLHNINKQEAKNNN